MTAGLEPLELRLRNDVSELGRLVEEVEGFADRVGIGMKELLALQLTLEELFMNVVNHAFSDRGEHHFCVRVALSDERELTVTFDDGGVSFDPTAGAPNADTVSPLEDRKVGGLGIHMVRQYADKLAYERRNQRNLLTLVKQLPDAP